MAVARPRRDAHDLAVRPTKLLLAVILALGVVVARPGACLACSCIAPPPLAELVAQNENLVVVVGRAAGPDGDRTLFGVERQFFGPKLPAVIRVVPATILLPDGSAFSNSCGIDLATGVPMFLVMGIGEDGSPAPSNCLPHARADTATGFAYIAEAEAAFGPGWVPAAASAAPASPSATHTATAAGTPVATPSSTPATNSPAGSSLLLAAGLLLAAALALIMGVTFAARRRRRDGA